MMRLLHEEGKIGAAELSATLYFYRTLATVVAVTGLVAFGSFKGVTALTGAGSRPVRR